MDDDIDDGLECLKPISQMGSFAPHPQIPPHTQTPEVLSSDLL